MKNLLILILVVALYFQMERDKPCINAMPKTESAPIQSDPVQSHSAVNKCMEEVDLSAFKNVQRAACYAKEVTRLEAILEENLKEALQKTPLDARQYLLDAEEAWSYSRDTWCNYVGSLPLAPLPLLNRESCLAEETSKHIDQLNMTKKELNGIAD